jgi:hypothetical protein
MEVGTPVALEFPHLYREYFCSLLIILELRGFDPAGTLEYPHWNIGVLE